MDVTKVKSLWGPGELLNYEQARASASPGQVPGTVLEDIFVPARGFMPAKKLATGQVMRFIDVEGQQVADVILYDPANLKNLSSMTNTVFVAKTWKITKGSALYSKFGDRMATIVEDTVGTNLPTGGFCSPDLNRIRFGIEGTHSCRLNLVASMSRYNLAPGDIEEGAWGVFQNGSYREDGSLESYPPISKPGDYLDMRADMDIIVALSNCPADHTPVNGWNPTPLRVLIYQPQLT